MHKQLPACLLQEEKYANHLYSHVLLDMLNKLPCIRDLANKTTSIFTQLREYQALDTTASAFVLGEMGQKSNLLESMKACTKRKIGLTSTFVLLQDLLGADWYSLHMLLDIA